MPTIQIGETVITETTIEGVTEYIWDDIKVYKLNIESYPGHITNIYLVIDNEISLIDTGLDGEKARQDLERDFKTINEKFGQKVRLEDVSGVIISHGHADHWGMLANAKFKGKKVYIHEKDTRVLHNFKTVFSEAKGRIREFVNEAGWDVKIGNFFNLDHLDIHYEDYEVTELTNGQRIINDYEVIHVPGHSPGSILLKAGPVLFIGDHILSETTPHQLPGSLVEGCGLRLYLNSLRKAADIGGDLLGLAAHEDVIYDIRKRVDEMIVFHYQRLADILELCRSEKNLFQVTDEYYKLRPKYINGKTVPELVRDEQVLALEEIRAHLDYLFEDGKISMLKGNDNIIRYHAS